MLLSTSADVRGAADVIAWSKGCNNYGDGIWQNFYDNDPVQYAPPTATAAEIAMIIGGETTPVKNRFIVFSA